MKLYEGCVGVDGAKSGWLAVSFEQDVLSWSVYETARDLVNARRNARMIAVDIPIGLPVCGSRRADVEARRFVGGLRASSIFPSPVRGILDSETQPEASRRHREIDGRGFGAQSFAILPKVREWDVLMRRDSTARNIVREIHPEVSFAALNGGGGLRDSKRTVHGRDVRIRLLSKVFDAEQIANLVRLVPKRLAVTDDILDALAALWSAGRIAAGDAGSLPSPVVEDETGLAAAIWY